MAKFSQQFLANLGRPQMAESLFGVGTAIGSVPGQVKAKAKQEQFNKIMDLANRAMVANDPVNLGRARRQLQELGFTEEANKLTAAQMQAEQRQTTTGLFQTALGQPKGLTPEQQADAISKGVSPEQVLAASELGKATGEPARDRGRARLRALATNYKFNPEDPKQLEGYLGIARATRVSQDEAMQILTAERGTQADRARITATSVGKPSFTTVGKIRDSRGFEYNVTEVRTGTGEGDIELKYQPIGHNTEWTPVLEDGKANRATFLGGAYSESGEDKSGRVVGQAAAIADIDVLKAEGVQKVKNFADLQDKAMQRMPSVVNGLNDVNTLLEIVGELEQGGNLVALQDKVLRVFGQQATEAGVFNNLAKELLVNRIKAFGANPTEGERAYLEQLIPALENTAEVNSALLNRMKTRLERERASINYIIQEGTTRESYIKFVDNLYGTGTPSTQPTGNKEVNFDDIN